MKRFTALMSFARVTTLLEKTSRSAMTLSTRMPFRPMNVSKSSSQSAVAFNESMQENTDRHEEEAYLILGITVGLDWCNCC